MNRPILAALAVLIVCGAGAVGHLRQISDQQSRLDITEDRLRGAMLDVRQARERELLLTDQLRTAVERTQSLTDNLSEVADGRAQLQKAFDDRDAYRLALEVMLATPEDRERFRTNSARPEAQTLTALSQMKHRRAALSRALSESIPNRVQDLKAVERVLSSSATDYFRFVYGRRLWSLIDELDRTARMASELASLARESSPDSLEPTAGEILAECDAASATLAQLRIAANVCQAAYRTTTLKVRADQDWQSSGLKLLDGDQLAISVWGVWFRPDAEPASRPRGIGPSGETGPASERLDESIGNGALILRIRGSNRIYSGWTSVAPDHAGDVEFRINDRSPELNRGELVVTATVFRTLSTPDPKRP